MEAGELREKNRDELRRLLIDKLRERFNLRIQRGSGQPSRPHLMREVRRDIARIKTVMREMQADGTTS